MNFPHYAGAHCSSSSIAGVLRFDGHEATEAMVFGLGSGVGFVYADDAAYTPVHRFNGRARDLEGKFYRLFGRELDWAHAWKPEAIEASLAAGRPLLAQTDIAYLPYYEPVHFPMHGIVVTGWDGEHATVADTISQQLQRVPAAALRAALLGEGCPWMDPPYRIASAPAIDFHVDAGVLARAIAVAAREMIEPTVPGTGVPAMRALAASALAWRDSFDWRWSARFAYQGIEKRGTGGGGFRALYADFLSECESRLPWLRKLDAVDRMLALASEWTVLAGHCRAAFVANDPQHLERGARQLDKVAGAEAVLFTQLASAAAEAPRFER